MTETSDEVDAAAEGNDATVSRAHLVFMISMVVLALIVIITATTLHTTNEQRSVEHRCDHIDFNIGLDWDRCGIDRYCDAEDGFIAHEFRCCSNAHVIDGLMTCCEPTRPQDPRGGLFDAEGEFSESRSARCELWAAVRGGG